jgi:hypothetical protein
MSRNESQTIRTLKTENRKLRREVARLEKVLRRYQDLDIESDECVEQKPERPKKKGSCPHCGSDKVRARIDLPNGKVAARCQSCGEHYHLDSL